jgi:hypothetical protein
MIRRQLASWQTAVTQRIARKIGPSASSVTFKCWWKIWCSTRQDSIALIWRHLFLLVRKSILSANLKSLKWRTFQPPRFTHWFDSGEKIIVALLNSMSKTRLSFFKTSFCFSANRTSCFILQRAANKTTTFSRKLTLRLCSGRLIHINLNHWLLFQKLAALCLT